MIEFAFEIVDIRDDLCPQIAAQYPLQALSQTSGKVTKINSGEKKSIFWLRGDIPTLGKRELKVMKPTVSSANKYRNEVSDCDPDFEASEYSQSLHVLADTRMTVTRAHIKEPKTRGVRPRTRRYMDKKMAPLFNDISIRPEKDYILSCGLPMEGIESVNIALQPFERDGGVLKRKIGDFNSFHGTCTPKSTFPGYNDPKSFIFSRKRKVT